MIPPLMISLHGVQTSLINSAMWNLFSCVNWFYLNCNIGANFHFNLQKQCDKILLHLILVDFWHFVHIARRELTLIQTLNKIITVSKLCITNEFLLPQLCKPQNAIVHWNLHTDCNQWDCKQLQVLILQWRAINPHLSSMGCLLWV